MGEQIERIVWLDSHSAGGGWIEPRQIEHDMQLSEIETVGWVVQESKRQITIAGSRAMDGTLLGEVLAIPKVAILSRGEVDT